MFGGKTTSTVATVIFLLFSAQCAYSALMVTDTLVGLAVSDESGDQQSNIEQSLNLPFSAVRTVVDGEATATAEYNFVTADNAGSFSFVYDLSRPGTFGSTSLAFAEIFFNVEDPSSFWFGGFSELTGTGRINFSVVLRDLTVSGGIDGFVYQSLQRSTSTANESFDIGGTGGDERNELRGTNPGILIPGHNYLMQLGFDILAIPEADNGASAHGEISFRVGSPAQVPLPSTSSLLLLILGSLFAASKVRATTLGVG